jgi:UDP-2,3-diacylglucosamine pyrophosphatase LpxH
MTIPSREVHVISDLHIGGRYPTSNATDDRGFRMCTRVADLTRFVVGLAERRARGADVELVINGDFVDFLAEEGADSDGEGEPVFVPFVSDPAEAERRFDVIAGRDAPLFDELRRLVEAGGRLTLLLGNHDVELSFPRVRRRLAERLGANAPARLTFLHDGEAYVVGDALIEHGNRYDGFNVVDHDALRRLRSLQSRNQAEGSAYTFEPPPGSRLVASIMNPIKKAYPFIDLLKPETEAVAPILLALEPGYRGKAIELIKLAREAGRRAPIAPAEPAYGGDIAASGDDRGDHGGDLGAGGADPLVAALAGVMPGGAAARFVAGLDDGEAGGDIASLGAGSAIGLARLLAGRGVEGVERRLPALLEALRAAQHDRSFDTSYETVPAYLDAARALADRGFRYVLFGHTHLAKRVDLGGGRAYLNTGTWADLIRFPEGIIAPGNPGALAELRAFVDDLAHRRFDRWICFRPTYARLDVRGDHVEQAELCTFA